MKRILFIVSLLLNIHFVSGQNYFQAYPITAVVGSNGSQQRLECSVYDSVLQNIQTYNSPWFNSAVNIKANGFGQVAFNTYNTGLGIPDSTFGFVIYDYTISQFKPEFKTFVPSASNYVNLGIDLSGVNYTINEFVSSYQNLHEYYFRYDINIHDWIGLIYYDGSYDNFNSAGYTPTGVRWVIKTGDAGDFWMFDPGDHLFKYNSSGCAGWSFTYEDDYLVADGSCYSDYKFTTYDPVHHEWKIFQSNDLCGNCFQNGGVFHAYGTFDFITFWDYFGTYDQSQHQYKIDAIANANIQGIVIKDRIVAYYNNSTVPAQIYYKAYSPTLHNWVTDSSDAQGITGLSINDGTVNWNDASGAHSVGYSDGTGWGGLSTPLQLSFYLTDLSASDGYLLVHVRNYTIGTDSVVYDFGDGIISTSNSKVLWHLYKNPGNYNICISNANGTQSVCQSVTFSQCSIAGTSSASSDTLCDGDSLTLSVSGYNGSVQWQRKVASVWVDETDPGSNTDNYQIMVSVSKSYRAKITSGICLPVMTNEILVLVYPTTAEAGTISLTQDSICSENSSKLTVANSIGSIQWQSYDGSNWVNETGTGSQSVNYKVSPGINTSYRAFVTSGPCASDSSNVLDLVVLSFPDPVTTNDTVCSSGVVNLTASGPGVINWYGSLTSVNPINTGLLYSATINTTNTYYTRATSGINFHVGAVDSLMGTVVNSSSNNRGIRFVANAASVIDLVYVYPKSGGTNVEISLYKSGSFIKKASQQVTPGSGKTAIYCGFELDPGITYDLKYTGNTVLVYNSTNAVYPYTASGSPVTITGSLIPAFSTGPTYYYFYDWVISEGCNSNMIPVTGVVVQLQTPIVTSNGPLSFCQGGEVELVVPSLPNYTYQWKRNGNDLTGDTLSTYIANTPGRYTVSVMLDTCTAVSNYKRITIPCIYQFDPQEKLQDTYATWNAYFSQATDIIHINANGIIGAAYEVFVLDNAGREVLSRKGTLTSGELVTELDGIFLAPGIYLIQLNTESERRVKRISIID